MSILTLTPAAEKQIDLLSEENECYGITLNIKGQFVSLLLVLK